VLQAVEAGSLGLDDLLTDRLPSAVTARIQNASSIRLRMLLDHRSGIPEWVTDTVHQAAVANPEHVWTLDEILAQVEKLPALFQPGEQYSYSNTNYTLLGEILTAVSGRSWRQILRDDVIARSGLEHTTLPEPGDPACDACAHGYQPTSDAMLDVTRVDPSMAGASGGHALITTPGDLTRFFQQVRAGALFEDPATVKAMFAFQPAIEAQTRQVGYGFGVMQMTSDGDDAIGHLGGTAGYQSFMLYVPATDRYLSGFINEMGGLAPVLGPVLARMAKP
jgi:D-alanyl-D-alanine carboxypeptidase